MNTIASTHTTQSRKPQKARKTSRTLINLLVDLAIFVAFLVAMDPRLTGIAVHEWLSIAFGAAIITHLLLHWDWLVATTKRFFGRLTAQARINYILNFLFFIAMTLVMFTGIMISEAALPLFGVTMEHSGPWRSLHTLSADATVIILGLHVALHWKWIVNSWTRYVWRPAVGMITRKPVAGATASKEVNA